MSAAAAHIKSTWLGMGSEKHRASEVGGQYTMPDGQVIWAEDGLIEELSSCVDMFYFEPGQFTVDVGFEAGLDDMIIEAIGATPIDCRKAMMKSMILTGGNAHCLRSSTSSFPGAKAPWCSGFGGSRWP